MARVYLLDRGTAGIDRLVTLGSPHTAPPKTVVDQSRGILSHVEATTPGRFHDEVGASVHACMDCDCLDAACRQQHDAHRHVLPQISYVTIGSKFVKGARLRGEGSWGEKAAGLGYQQVCGEAEVWGDGITPLPAVHLEGLCGLDCCCFLDKMGHFAVHRV